MNYKIPLRGSLISTIEAAMVAKIMERGEVAGNGLTKTLERELAAHYGYEHARCVSTGHAALTVALRAVTTKGTRVALPVIAPASTLSAIRAAECEPVFVDVTSDCRANMLYDRIPEDTGIVMPVHPFGRAIDGKAPPFLTVEDARQAIYAEGTGIGDVCCLSLDGMGVVHGGMGGVILCSDKTILAEIDKAIQHRGVIYSDLNAALAYAQHINRDVLVEAYQTVGNTIAASLQHIPWLECPPVDNHTFTTFPIVINQNVADPKVINKNTVMAALHENDIDARCIIPLVNDAEKYPHANYVSAMGMRIPCHPMMTEENIGRIVDTLESVDGHN